MVKIILPVSKKRQEPPETLDGQPQKKRKMDHGVKIECGKILRTLMIHKFGPVFNQPVDPVELGIPDYFLIISHPMDFGTIRTKLEDDAYLSPDAFAADIRLTFSNAMHYNPPNNCVHLMAKEMNDLFDRSWRSLEAKLIKPSKNGGEQGQRTLPAKISTQGFRAVKQTGAQNGRSKIPLDTVKIPSKSSESKTVRKQNGGVIVKAKKTEDTSKTSTSTCSEEKPSISCEEKARLKKELMVALRGDLTGPMRGFLRKYGLIYSRKEKIESVFGSFGDDTLWELKRVVKCSLGTTTSTEKGKGDSVKTQRPKELSERQKLEEKSNIESRIRAARAAKEAILENARSDLQRKRDRERERVEQMERTVTMDDNLTVLRELEKLCQYSGIKNPLEKLGLRLKEEYYYGYEYIGDDDDGDELEDGEIF